MKSSIRILLALAILVPLTPDSRGEPSTGGRENVQADSGRVWKAPTVDVERLKKEDEANRRNKQVPWRVGYPMRTNLSPSNSGTWSDLANGDRVWRLDVRSKKAKWLVLGFSQFELPPGAELWLQDALGKPVYGPKTSTDIRPHGQLWFPPVAGSQVTVELRWPKSLQTIRPALHLGTVSHGYREWGSSDTAAKADTPPPALAGSGSCNNDVACPAGIGWQDEARSVVRVLSGGFAFCSGALINNTANDCTPYILTADHCNVNPASTTYQFSYQNANCGSGPTVSSTHVLTGSTRKASFGISDFDLLLLDDEIPESFNVFYSGWSRSSAAGSRSTGIHHPRGDVKKISHNEDPLINGLFSPGYGRNYWRVTEWEDGTTEPSSSGSPLYNQDKHIVGQLRGGEAACGLLEWDEYGKTSVSWVGGGSSSSRLSDWLDPIGTGATTLDGIDHSYCLSPFPELSVVGFTIDDTAGNGDGIADPGETVDVFVSLANTGSGGATQVVGIATTSSPLASVTQGAVSWPAIESGGTASAGIPLTLAISPDLPCGSTLSIQLATTAAEDPGSWNFDFVVTTGSPTGVQDGFADDMESGDESWTTENFGPTAWLRSTSQSLSPVTSWYAPEVAGVTDIRLLLDEITNLPAASELSFWHLMSSEPGFDGGVFEYSTDGAHWNDAASLITVGGYNLSISTDWNSPIAGRPAWSGNLGFWRNVELDLSPLAGMDVQFRWRFATDEFIANGVGWYVDDVLLRYSGFECSETELFPPGEVSGPETESPFLLDKADGGYFLSWSEPVDGSPVEQYVLYSQQLGDSKRNVPVCVGSLGSVMSAVMDLPDGRQFMVVGSNQAGEGPYGYDSDGLQRNAAPETCP